MAAQDAELKLKVSLDLGFFRQQLAGLGQAAAGYNLPVRVQFDRRSVQDELNALGANIRRRNYRLTVETNLSAEIAKADTLARKLGELSGKLKATRGGGGVAQGREAISQIEEVLRGGLSGRAFGIQKAQENIAKQAILSRLEKASLSKGGYNTAGLEKIIRDLGGTPTGGRKDLVAQAKKLVEESNGITDAVFDNLKDLQMKLRPIRGQAQTSAARSMPNLNQMLDRIANLTENPRAAQRMLRMMPESRLTTDLIGAANRQAAFREQYGAQGFRLPGFGGAKAFDPLLKSIAESFSDYTRTVNTSNPWMGKIGSGITTLISRALTQSPEQMFGGRTPVASAKLLPAAGQTSGTRLMREQLERANLPLLQAPSVGQENAPLSRAATYMLNRARRALELPIGPYSPYEPNPFAGRATVPSRQYFTPTMQAALPPVGATGGRLSLLEQQLAQSRGALGTGGGVAGSLFTGRALINPGISMLSPVGISGNYRQMAAALANQAANPALAHRQIADIGFGGVPTAATGMSGEALNRALNQAFLQRRGLGIGGGQSLPIFNAPGVAVQQNIPGMAYQMGGGGLGGSMGMFPSAGMMGPSSPLTINAQSSMFGGGGAMPPGGGGGGAGGMGGMGGFGRALGSVNLPGAGAIRELGQEFAFATQQVLLFGQAYKMLAFIQNFPAQVGAAVSQLQNFRNTLDAISPTAEEAASSNRLILDLVEKYNVPLQSARDGFTKLYASMAPAGFSGDQVRDLFTGITQAAATFGMSADKVDRVNYAFAQMASKGQVMSEELKGQLGDVLPGAMAIFAEAAGFKGPKAIQDFSAALEDGAYKGQAMVALLNNVGIVMKQEFGPGAEGAARTFQGVINRMQNSMTLLYESFEPVAVGFLNTVVVPLTDGIKQISDGFNAFFTGTAAQTAGGFGIAQELERLRPAFDGIAQNMGQLIDQFGQFARIALDVGKILLQIAGNPLVGYLARLYAIALPINIALNVMKGLWASNALQLAIFNARVATGSSTLSAFRGMMAATGATAQTTAASIRTAGITLRTFFATTGIGLVVTGISMLIERIMMLNQKMDETRQKAAGAASAIRMMSGTEARAAEQSYAGFARSLEGLNKQLQEGQLRGKAWIAVNRQQQAALEAAGITPSVVRGQAQIQPTRIAGAYQKLMQLQAEASYQVSRTQFEEKQAQQQLTSLPSIPIETKEKDKTKGMRRNLDEIVSAEILRLSELEKANIKLAQAETAALAPDTIQAERMLDYYEKFRNNLVDIQAIQAQISMLEQNRAKFLQIGLTGEELDARLKDLRNELKIATIDLAATEQDYRNQAKQDAEEEARQIQEKIKKQQELNRLLEDAAIAADKISPRQAGIIQQRRGFQDTVSRATELGATQEQIGSLQQLQMAVPEAGSVQEYIRKLREELQQLISVQNLAAISAQGIGQALGEAMTTGVASLISGTATAKEVFASFLQSVGQALSQAASQMIATYIAIGIAKMFAGLGGGGGNPAGSGGGISDSLPGIRQYAGGLGGGGAPGSMPFAPPAFANGGIVTGPTLSLIGEGKYNEAIVPLPDGRSIPVQLGGRSARDLMGNGAPGMPQAPSLSMKFETTKINGVEYVSREQLEQAMAETRRASIAGGAKQGMSMTLDKIKQSPSTRSSIGIR